MKLKPASAFVSSDENVVRLVLAAAKAMRPADRVEPAVWTERHVELSSEMSPGRPGPIDLDWKPWQRDVHDLLYLEPHKRGMFCMKPTQVGFTRSMLNLLSYLVDTNPGPFLYLISDKDQAAHFQLTEFSPVIDSIPRLKESFASTDKKFTRETTYTRSYVGGRVDFAGAGSTSSVSSRPYVLVMVDEWENCLDNFPSAKAGGLFGFANGRGKASPDLFKLIGWSHPRKIDEGIHEQFSEKTDQRHWVFDCPGCGGVIVPEWKLVRFAAADLNGNLDPDSAEFVCPHCGKAVGDHERASATLPARRGGTGGFESQLDEDVAAKREYIGLAINRLADPHVTIRSLAMEFVAAKTDRDRMAFFNLSLGEPFSLQKGVVTAELVSKAIDVAERVVIPGGPWGVHYLTAGVDVQAPKDNPMLYVWVSAWLGNSSELVVALEKIKGWAALHDYLRRLTFPVSVDGQISGEVQPQLCSIDCGFATGSVLDFCRSSITNSVSGRSVKLLPMRARSHVKADAWAVMPPENKRLKPGQTELGPIDLYDLHRHTIVDRRMQRLRSDDRMRVICETPGDFVSHMTANAEVPLIDKHGWGDGDLEWQLIKNRSDDWMQAGAYSEVGAVLRLGLDTLFDKVMRRESRDAPGTREQQARPETSVDDDFRVRDDWM